MKRKNVVKIEAVVSKRARFYLVAILTRIGRTHQSSTLHSKWQTRSEAQHVAGQINRSLEGTPI